MYMRFFKRTLLGLTLPVSALLISACSSDSPFDANATSINSTTDTAGNVNVVRIGTTVSGIFSDGVALVTPSTISAAGTSVISVELVDANAVASTSSVAVTFASPCVTSGLASFSNPTFLSTNGTATTNYLAKGCVGSDIVTATISGSTQAASGTVTIASATAGSLQLSNVSASLIALSGTGSSTGLPENSTVTFVVKDDLGLPVKGETVDFTLNNAAGGITLSSASATSDGAGEVTTTVQSGSVATSVRVTATLNSNTALTTTSSAISIATGPPDQDSFSIAVTELNPRAWDVNGKVVVVSAYLADRFNNPITDGTAISFTTELGAIEASCTTVNGSCTVNWTSQAPRTNSLATTGPAGFSTIQATVEGEESFLDIDADGVFSDGDTFTDLAEAFRDDNANGTHDDGELFSDFNNNGIRDPANGKYNGKGCTHSTLCDTVIDAVTVSQSGEIVLAESTVEIIAVFYDNVPQTFPLPTFNTRTYGSISFIIGGAVNSQVLPVGSKVSATTTNGKITGGTSNTVANIATAAETYTVSIDADDKPSDDGNLTLNIALGDDGGSVDFGPIAINDIPQTYTIGGSLTGLPGATKLFITNNEGESNLTLTGDGAFTFTTQVPDGQPYAVTILDPTPVGVTCTVTNGSSDVNGANITDVIITCI